MPADTYLTAQTAWTLEVEGGLGEASGALSDPGPPPERYEMRGLIGRGGMGEVWRVRDHVLQRDLVRKVLRPELLSGRVSGWVSGTGGSHHKVEQTGAGTTATPQPGSGSVAPRSQAHDYRR